MVSLAMPRSSRTLSSSPTCMSCSTMPSLYSSCPEMPRCSAFTWVRKCMRVPFHQQKNGFHALLCERAGILDGLAALAIGLALEHAARTELLSERGILRIVLVLGFLLGIEVIEVAEELV